MSDNLDLSRVQRIQAAFDAENDNYPTANTPEGKLRHTLLHLGKAAGKAMTYLEQAEHGTVDTTILEEEVMPDLIVFAGQLAAALDTELGDAYISRLYAVSVRNGTGVESAERALQTE